MSVAVHLDKETRSTVDLTKVGVDRYAEHPTTRVILFSANYDGDPDIEHWRFGQPVPRRLIDHVHAGKVVKAHNARFERTMWNVNMRQVHNMDLPLMTIEQMDCTMARANTMALPSSLEKLGQALKSDEVKDHEGRRLMLQMCKPRKVYECLVCGGPGCETCDGAGVLVDWWEDEDRVVRLSAYCDQDTRTEQAADGMLPALSISERRLWELDQRINDRGFCVDSGLARAAVDVVKVARARANVRIAALTDGEVTGCTQTARIVAWLAARGLPCTSVAKGEIEELVLSADVLSDQVAKEVVQLRRASVRTSTDKFKKAIETVCRDGRLRGTLVFNKAGTGRWAGALVQPQNFPRVDADREAPVVADTVEILRTKTDPAEATDCIDLVCGPPMEWLSKSLRSMIVAAPRKRLVGGDLANIEGRVNAWISGEQWKLDAFRAYDTGDGADLYSLTYSRSFGIPLPDVTKPMRQIGKVQELALGYQGGVGAFISLAANYLMDVNAVAKQARDVATEAAWYEASEQHKRQPDYGLSRETWVGLRTVVNAYRAANPNIMAAWWELQDAAIDAVSNHGLKVPALNGRICYLVANDFLFCRLPSGRVLAYATPKVEWVDSGRRDSEGKRIKKRTVTYWGVDGKTKRWCKQYLYGGMQDENIVQAISRDVLVEGMFRIEEAGRPIILTIHDEVLVEVDEDDPFSSTYLESLMTITPDWADANLPLSAKAWEDTRYVK